MLRRIATSPLVHLLGGIAFYALVLGVWACIEVADAQPITYGQGVHRVADEGTLLATSPYRLNCVGTGVACSINGTTASQVDITVAAAGSTSGGTPTVTVKSEATAAAAGAATTVLRSDAQIQALTAAPTVQVLSDASTAQQGVASSLLRSDARLLVTTGAAVASGAANAQGTSSFLARADHTHDTTPDAIALAADTTGDYCASITAGAGLASTGATTGENIAHTLSTASTEAGFLTDGAAVDLTCGASNQGKAQVLDDGQYQWCDGATTSVLRRAAFGNASGAATELTCTGCVATAEIADNAVDGTKIAIVGQVAGDLPVFDGTDWVRTGPGLAYSTANTRLSWATGSGVSNVTTMQVTSAAAGAGAVDLLMTNNAEPNLYLRGGIAGTSRTSLNFQLQDATADFMRLGQVFTGSPHLSTSGHFQIGIDANNTGTGVFELVKANSFNGRAGTDGTILMRVDNNGNVGVGTRTPATSIEFVENAAHTIQVEPRATNAAGNALTINAANAGAGATGFAGGALNLNGGNAAGTAGNANGGDIVLNGGTLVNAGTAGNVVLANLRGRVGIGTASPIYAVQTTLPPVGGAALTIAPTTMVANDTGLFVVTPAITGGIVGGAFSMDATANADVSVRNANSTSASANARFIMRVIGGSAGDPIAYFDVNGVQDWTVGIDNSDADKFKISTGAVLGTTDRLTIDTAGLASFAGGVTLGDAAADVITSTGDFTFSNMMRAPKIANTAPAQPFACGATRDGAIVYVDDTDDAARARLCLCATIDNVPTYDWILVDDNAVACPFF